jgi:hypothetical protein
MGKEEVAERLSIPATMVEAGVLHSTLGLSLSCIGLAVH